MIRKVELSGEQLAEVKAILAMHLPIDVRLGVFGSRATGMAKPWSDLDLVIDAHAPIPIATMAALTESFEESLLPFKLDLVDRCMISDAFRRIVDATMVSLA